MKKGGHATQRGLCQKGRGSSHICGIRGYISGISASKISEGSAKSTVKYVSPSADCCLLADNQ